MEVPIFRRDIHGNEKKWKYFYFVPEEDIYENERIKFAHFMWDVIIKQKYEFNHEFEYVRDWYSYDNAFNRLSFSGEGIYLKGRKVIGLKDLEHGFPNNMVEIGNYLYFIQK